MEFREWLRLDEAYTLPPGYTQQKRAQAGYKALGNVVGAGVDLAAGPVNAIAGAGRAIQNAGAAFGGQAGRNFSRGIDNVLDRVKKNLIGVGSMMWVRDGTGNVKYDVEDTISAMMSDAQKREVEATLENKLKRGGYAADNDVPDHLGTMVAMASISQKVRQVQQNLGLDASTVNSIMRYRGTT